MRLDVPCKAGKLQVTDDQYLRVVAPFNKTVWQVATSEVNGFTTQPGSMGTVNITISTSQGQYVADMVTKPNFTKLQALFQNAQTEQGGKEWYFDPRALTHVATYTDQRQMQRDIESAYQQGWIIQGQSAVGGRVSPAKIIAGEIIAGPLGALIGAKREKDKTTITFVRSPEWLAAHRA